MADGVIAEAKEHESELTNESSSSKLTDDSSSSVEESPFKKAKLDGSVNSVEDEEEPPKVEPVEETEDEDEDESEYEDEYEEEDDDPEESDSDEDKVEREYRVYRRHIAKTGGFYVDPDLIPSVGGFGIILPVDLEVDDLISTWAKQGTHAAIAKYNTKHKDSPLELAEIIRATHNKILFYLTFTAKEVSSGDIQTYQAMVRQVSFDSKVFFVRPERNYATQGGAVRAMVK